MRSFNLGRQIPTDSTEVKYEKANSVVYLYDGGKDRFNAIAYVGKRTKSEFHYTFKSEERRSEYIKIWITEKIEEIERKEERNRKKKEERSTPHTMKIGDIMYSSWGYDQTNVDFYQVVGTTKNTVKLRKICGKMVEHTQSMAGYTEPVKDSFVSEDIISKRINCRNYGSLSDFQHLSKYDNKPLYCSWYA